MSATVTHEFIEVGVDALKPARFNPTKRTMPKNLGGLMGSIASNGMPVPIVITENMEVGDGHRRLACAKALKWPTVPAVVWKGKTAQEIWSILNAHQMSMTPAQWLEAVVCGMSIDQPEIPRSLANTIRELLDILDDETVWQIVEEGKSPEILKTAKFVNNKIGWSDKEHTVKTIQWFLAFDGQAKARAVITGGYEIDILAECIENNRDFDFEIVPK